MTYQAEVSYRLDLSDHDDNVVATFAGIKSEDDLDFDESGLHSFSCRDRLATAGAFSARIFGKDSRIEKYLRLDVGVDYKWRVYRTDPLWDNKERKIGMFFHRGEQDEQLAAGNFLYSSYGTGPNVFFNSEPIVFDKGSPQALKEGEVAKVAYEYVNENLGAGAGVDSLGLSRVRKQLVLQPPADSPTGKIWTGDRSNKIVGDVLRELALFDIGDYKIVEAENFDMIYDFRYTRWGKDLTLGNTEGNTPLLLSPDNNSVHAFNKIYSFLNEVNVVTVLGSGVDDLRPSLTSALTDSLNKSPWARKAIVRNVDGFTPEELLSKAEAKLTEGLPRLENKFSVVSDVVRYGRDWNLGDLIDVGFKDRYIPMKVVGITFTLQRTGKEIVTPEFKIEPSYFLGG